MTLLYGNRRSDSVMFADDVADLKDAYPARMQLVHVLSREPQEVELFSGRLDAGEAARAAAGHRRRARRRPLVAVRAVRHGHRRDRACSTELGVAADRVHRELFYVEEEPPTEVRHEDAPAGPGAEVTVMLDGRTSVVTVPPDTAMLDGAQQVRPDLPFACKGGVCGTCRALVTDGEVRMRRNYALEADEVEAGYVLTCQSLPVTDTVTVDYDS